MRASLLVGAFAIAGLFLQPGSAPSNELHITVEQWTLYATIIGAMVGGVYTAVRKAARQANVDAGLQPQNGKGPLYYERVDNLKTSLDSLTETWNRNRDAIEQRFNTIDQRHLRYDSRLDGLVMSAAKGDIDRERIESLLTDVKNMSEIMKRDLKKLAGKVDLES